MSINGGAPTPITRAPEHEACQRCPRCHPGKSYSTAFCRVSNCGCHRLWRASS